jgi:hypothetical protein
MCDKCDGPVTKETLIEGVLTMHKAGLLSDEIVLSQIKKFAQDDRVHWKEFYL